MISSGARPFRLLLALLALLAPGSGVAVAQSQHVRTLEDRDHVTVMEFGGVYDRQPEANQAYEQQVRQAVAREFLRTHTDDYDFIVVFTRFGYSLGSDSEGAQVGGRYYGVKNDVEGIGVAPFDASAEFGSASGRLQGFIDMGVLSRLGTDPTDPRFEQTLSVLAHEFMHRWGSHVRFRAADGSLSPALLGRDGSHWNFLLNTHNSVHYGHEWRDNGDGTFTSVGRAMTFYSPLDLYLMGMLDRSQVPPFFLIENPSVPPGRLPEVGTTITGTRREVTIDDIVAAEGERLPSAAAAPKRFKMGFVFLVRPGEQAEGLELSAINTIRDAFSTRALILTGGKGVVQVYPEEPAAPGGPTTTILPPSSGPRSAPVDLVQALDWVLARQAVDGLFADSAATRVRDTAAALDLLREVPAAFTSHQRGLAWLSQLQEHLNVDMVSRRLLAISPQYSATDAAFLADARNGAGGWGLRRGYRSDALDTALALLASPVAPGPADIAFIVNAQNPDGGWAVRPGSPSSVQGTLAVLRLNGRLADAALTAALQRGEEWLASRQRTDGGFGEDGSTVYETADAVLYLLHTAFPKPQIAHALDWLRSRQLADGSWNESTYQTALALRALKVGELPNAAVSSAGITFSLASPIDGQAVTVRALVVNDGVQDVTNLRVGVFDGDPAAGGIPIGADVVIAHLPALSQLPLTVTWDTTGRAGPRRVFVAVDRAGQIDEFNEADNIASADITVRQPPVEPDLSIEQAALVLMPGLLQALPQDQTITATIANSGLTTATNVGVTVFEGDPALGRQVGETAVTVPGRGQAQVTVAFRVTTPGEHRYFVVADALGQVAEADETNNVAFTTLLVQSTHDFLVVPGTLTASENPTAPGRDLAVSAQVRNQGTTDAFSVVVRFYIDDPGGAIDVASRTVDLPAGGTATVSAVWRTSRALNAVPLAVDIDPANAFPESSETNNRASIPLTVSSSSAPNLHVAPASVQVTTPVNEGAPATVSLPVLNNGAADAANVTVAFFVGLPASGGLQIGTTQTIPVLPAGDRAIASVVWTPLERGDKLIFAVVDAAGVVAEFDEADNSAFITVPVRSRPDLAISPATISFAPAFPRQGEPVVATAIITNTGEQAAPARVRFFDGDPARGGVALGVDQVIPSLPGQSTAAVQVAFDGGTAAVRAIYVQVDPLNEVAEQDEANNIAFRTLGIQDGSLFASNLYFSPNGDERQDTTVLFFRFEQPQVVGSVTIANRQRRLVRTIELPDEATTSGSATWDGRDDQGRIVADGAYDMTVASAAGVPLGATRVVVDTNNLPVGDAVGTRFLLDHNLTCGLPLESGDGYVVGYSTIGWLPDDTGLVKAFATAAVLRGGRIQYSEQAVGVYVIAPDGETTTRITPDSWTVHPPAGDGTRLVKVSLSPDGGKVLVAVQKYRHAFNFEDFYGPVELWVVNTDGSGLRKIGETPEGALIDAPYYYQLETYWAPGGDRVAFTVSFGSWFGITEARLYLANADGSGQALVQTIDERISSLGRLAWSPDGTRLLYSVLEQLPSNGYIYNLYAILPDGTGRRMLAASRQDFSDLSGLLWLSRDRFAILTSGRLTPEGYFDYGNDTQLYLLTLEGAAPQLISRGGGATRQARVSPQGGQVAFAEDAVVGGVGRQRIWVTGPDGVARDLYTTGDTTSTLDQLGWSADGGRLAWIEQLIVEQRTCSDPESGVYPCPVRLSAVGSVRLGDGAATVVPITGPEEYVNPIGLFPDGGSFMFQDGDGRLLAVSLVDGTRTTILADTHLSLEEFPFSPSGKYLLYTSSRDASDPTRPCWKGTEYGRDDFALTSVLNLTAQFGFKRDRSQLSLRGTAEDANFAGYRLEYAPVAAASAWQPIGAASETAVVNGLLSEWIPPSDGTFYVRLTAQDLAGNVVTTRRRITWGLTPGITNVAVAPRIFSPNADGTRDTVTVDYLVLGPVNLAFEIYDAANTLVRRIEQSHTALGAASVAWDGRSDAGQFVADGAYRIHVLDFDFFVTVDTTVPATALTLGSGFHVVPQRVVCLAPGAGVGCRVVPGPLVQTPFFELAGTAVDPQIAQWRLEIGVGSNPAEWQFVADGSANHGPQTPFVTLTALDTVVNRRYRLTAIDQAGNRSVTVSNLAAQELILHAYDGEPVPTAIAIEQRLGVHALSLAYTGRTPAQWFTVQHRLQGTSEWASSAPVAPAAGADLPWDNSTLAPGRVYEVRVVSTDANGAQLTSNAILIRSNVFLLLEYLEDVRAVRGVISLNDTIQSLTLVTVAGDQDLTGASTFHGGPDFLVQVVSDATIKSCSSRPRIVRFKAVGATGRVYYSNSAEVNQFPPPSAVVCPSTGSGSEQSLTLQVSTLEAPVCGLPSPGQVRVTILTDGSLPGAKLFVQRILNGPLVEQPGLSAVIDTAGMPEGVYQVRATAGLQADGQPSVVKTRTFVVDRQAPTARITYPVPNQSFCGVQVNNRVLVPVEGIAEDPNFSRYVVEYGVGDNPQAWSEAPIDASLGAGATPRRGILANWDVTGFQSGTYSLRQRVYDRGGSLSCSTVSFFLPGPIAVLNPRADVRLISPNGDGVSDSTTIAYELRDPATISVRVYALQNGQRAAVPVRTLVLNTGQLAGANSVAWNGLNDGGVAPPDGTYQVVISGGDACGHAAEGVVPIVIDNTRPEALIASPLAGAPLGLVTDVRGTVSDVHFQSYRLEVGETDAPASWTLVAAGLTPTQDSLLGTWTRTGTAGTFTLRLTATDTAGNVREARLPLTVSDTAGLVSVLTAAPALFSPNLDGRRDTTVVAYEALSDLRISLDVLDSTDTVVRVLSESDALASSRYTVGWDGRNEAGVVVPDGSYVVRLTAASRADVTRTQVERTAVVVDTTLPALAAAVPTDASFVRGEVAVTGSASDLHLDSYAVSFALQPDGAATMLDQGRQSRTDYRFGALAGLPDGLYALTLTAEDVAQNTATRTVAFTVDNTAPEVALTAPAGGAFAGGATAAVEISGTVRDVHLRDWTLRVGPGADPQSWTALATGTAAPAPGSALATWNVAALADGPYTVSLVGTDRAGATAEARVSLVVDNTPPTAIIRQPLDGSRLGAAAAIRGDAADVNFREAVLDFAPGHGAAALRFEPLIQLTQPIADGVLFAWQALPPDGAYTLRLRVTDQLGQTAESRVQVTLDTEPPRPPSNLAAAVEARRNVRLTWLASLDADAAGYHVYRDGTRLTSTPLAALTYFDENLPEGAYQYLVRAVDAGGLESAPSAPASARINLTPPATRITGPAAGAVVSGLVDIRGTAAAPDDFREYRLSVGEGAAPSALTLVRRSPAQVTAGLLAEFDTTARPEGTVLTFRLEGEDLEGNVATDQVTVSIDNVAPAAPVLVSAVPGGSDITVQWQANLEADLAGYLLYDNHLLANVRRIVNGSITPYLLPGPAFLDRALPDGDHEYYLVAVDRAGNISAASNVLVVTLETRAPRATITQPANNSATETAITLLAGSIDQDVARVQFQIRADADAGWTDLGAADAAAPYQAAWDPQGLAFGVFHFRAVATDTRGNTDAAPPSIAVTLRDLTPPAAPGAISAVVNGDSVVLTWPVVGDADLDGYAVYRRTGTEPAVRISGALVTAATFTDRGVPDGDYLYSVRAIDRSANESAASPAAAAAIGAPALTAPQVCLAGETTSIAGTGAAPLSSVALFVATAGGDPVPVASTLADAAGAFSFTAVAIAPGVNVFTARATDGSGNVSRTSAALAITQSARPDAPRNFTASVSGNDVALSWDPSAGISLYALTRNGAPATPAENVTSRGTAAASSAWPWWLQAQNAVDGSDSSYWSPAVSDPAPWWQLAFPAPEPVIGVTLNWGNDSGSPDPVRSFDIEAWDGSTWRTLAQVQASTAAVQTIALNAPVLASAIRLNRLAAPGGPLQLTEVQVFSRSLVRGTSFTDVGLPDGRYTYELTALNTCGLEGLPARAEAAVGDVIPPAAPAALVASAAGSTVTLSWNPVADPDTAGYHVYRHSSGTWTRISDAVVPSPGFVEANVRNGDHLYRVVAVDAAGNESAPSNDAGVTVDVPLPPATLLVVTAPAEGGALDLGWQVAPGGVVGYRILRAAAASGPYLPLHATAGPAAAYRDAAVVSGTRYFYVVRALDAAGNESADSNVADGVPVDRLPPAAPVLLYPTDAARPRSMTAAVTTIGGLAEPGSTVTLLNEGYPLGQSAATSAVTSDVLTVPGGNSMPAFLASDSLLATFARPSGTPVAALTFVDIVTGATAAFPAAADGYSPAFAPDGRTLVYVESNGRALSLFDRSTGQVSATFARPHEVSAPRISPDGRSIVYIGGSYPGYAVWILDVVTGAARVVATDTEYPFEPAWSAAGDVIAFSDYRLATGVAELKLVTVATGAVSVIDANVLPEASSFAPDGSRLAFTSLRNGRAELWIHDIASGTAAPLVDDGAERTSPVFGPDGERIAYMRAAPGGSQTIYVYEFATAADSEFYRDAPTTAPLWTLERGMLLPDSSSVRRIRPAGVFSFRDVALPFERNVFSAVAADTAGNQGAPAEPITLLRERRSLPDLAISDASIVAYPRFPVQGESVRLSATVLNEGDVAATGATVGFYRQLAGGRLVLLAERTIAALASRQQAVVSFDWQTAGLSGGQTIFVIADAAGAIPEFSELNNEGRAPVVITVDGSPAVTVATDRSLYPASATVTVDAEVANPGGASDFILELRIEDDGGFLVSSLLTEPLPAFGYDSRRVRATWPAAGVFAGGYHARAVLRRAGAGELSATAPFTVTGERVAQAEVTTDRAQYQVGDVVQISPRATNPSQTVDLGPLRIFTRIVDASGAEVMSAERDVPVLLTGAAAQLPVQWAAAHAGSYTVQVTVSQDGQALAAAHVDFSVCRREPAPGARDGHPGARRASLQPPAVGGGVERREPGAFGGAAAPRPPRRGTSGRGPRVHPRGRPGAGRARALAGQRGEHRPRAQDLQRAPADRRRRPRCARWRLPRSASSIVRRRWSA